MGGNSVKSLTLVEIIFSIVVLSIIIIPVIPVFATVSKDTGTGIYINRASTLGTSYMELVLSRSFDENSVAPWTQPANLGPEVTETDVADYDDVDDFNGYSFTDSDYPDLNGEIEVYYVDDPDGTADWDSVSSSATNYKRIDVKVTHSQLGTTTISNGVTHAAHTTK